jgi:hypothetical protein
VLLAYVAVFILAAFLLWRFSHIRWYWHAGAVVIALALGMMPLRPDWNGPTMDLTFGALFLFLVVWGCGEPLFKLLHLPRHA